MFRFLRFLLTIGMIVFLVWFSVTVPLGSHTLSGHLKRIWGSEETQDLVRGTKEAAKPAAEKVKRVVKSGVDEARRDP